MDKHNIDKTQMDRKSKRTRGGRDMGSAQEARPRAIIGGGQEEILRLSKGGAVGRRSKLEKLGKRMLRRWGIRESPIVPITVPQDVLTDRLEEVRKTGSAPPRMERMAA